MCYHSTFSCQCSLSNGVVECVSANFITPQALIAFSVTNCVDRNVIKGYFRLCIHREVLRESVGTTFRASLCELY
jgi:hypothetical protein